MKLRKLGYLCLAATMLVGLTACGKTQEVNKDREMITIESKNGIKEAVSLEVPYNPERIAVLDLAALDILDNLGVGDRVVGTSDTSIPYLTSYSKNDQIANLGTIKEADMEAVMACDPDIIFIGGRLASSYDALSEIAPVVYLPTDVEIGLVESVKQNATTIASIFGLEEKVEEKLTGINTRIDELKTITQGKTALVGMTTSGSFNLLGNDGRCSLIGRELGFDNIGILEAATSGEGQQGGSGKENTTSSHGNEASFEIVLKKNPEYIFVMDRDSAIAAEGAQMARDIMENELVKGTDAYQKNQIVYLQNPAIWYMAEGGITALDIMLSDVESQFTK